MSIERVSPLCCSLGQSGNVAIIEHLGFAKTSVNIMDIIDQAEYVSDSVRLKPVCNVNSI